MDTTDPREKFASIASLPDADIDLIEAALLIAAENDDIQDTNHYHDLLRNMASRYAAFYDPHTTLGGSVSGLSEFIHKIEEFGGKLRDYFVPENNYLNRVLETKQGIPITLALIHIGIGREVNLPVGGINFPGHFLVRYGHDNRHIVDPFSGRILSISDCVNLLQQVKGGKIKLQEHHFEFAKNKEILMRILDNLKLVFWHHQSWNESRSCLERQLLLAPESDELELQLAAVDEMLGYIPIAQENYSRILQRSKDKQIIETASKRLLALTPSSTIRH